MTDHPERPAGGVPPGLAAGWKRAILWGVVAFLLVALLGQAYSFLNNAAAEDIIRGLPGGEGLAVLPGALGDLSAGQAFQAGAANYQWFHHVAFSARVSDIPIPLGEELPFPAGIGISVQISLAYMLGTLLAGYLLYRGGRAVAMAGGGPGWARPLHGLKVALPYVVLSFAYSFAARFDQTTPVPGAGEITVNVAPVIFSAIAWPLVISAVAGAAGGLGTTRLLREGSWERGQMWLRAALAGGWRMAWLAVALSFVGFLIVAAVNPGETGAYFDLVGRAGFLGGSVILLATAFLMPNLSTAIGVAAMGGSLDFQIFGSSCAVISYGRFIGNQQAGGEFVPGSCESLGLGPAAAPYFLFLLVPLAATVLGGYLAARRFHSRTRGEAALVGASAAPVYAFLMLAFMLLASITFRLGGPFAVFLGGGGFAVTPGLLVGTLLALLWGAAGGAVGGLLGYREAPAGTESPVVGPGPEDGIDEGPGDVPGPSVG